MEIKTYIALTIGPIYKTIQSVKSTKGIWGASYMFSYMMKEIINELVNQSNGSPEFLMPYIEYNSNGKINWSTSTAQGVGLLPDRFIMKAGNDEFTKMKSDVIDQVFETFADKAQNGLSNHFNSYNRKSGINERRGFYQDSRNSTTIKTGIKTFLEQYIHTYYIEITDPGKNPVLEVQNYLDNIELQQKIMQKEEMPYLYDLLENCYYNFMVKQEFGKAAQFPSIIEVASKQFEIKHPASFISAKKILNKKDDRESQGKFIQELKNTSSFPATKFLQHHKYITIVQADGDNMGHLISTIYDIYDEGIAKDIFVKFSYNILSFAKCAVELIKDYGGTNIYAGGDDLLFFTPVMVYTNFETDFKKIIDLEKTKTSLIDFENIFKDQPEGKSIFWLIENIDKLFHLFITDNELFEDVVAQCKLDGKPPGMSYGVSVSYYKFPLNEALDQGYKLLTRDSKKRKDAVSFRVLKHSGQYFGTTFLKKERSYERFNKMLNMGLDDENFLSSVMHKLDDLKWVLLEISSYMPDNDNKDDASNRLLQFFINSFDEKVHRENERQIFLTDVRHLVREVFCEKPSKEDVSEGNHEQWLDLKMAKIYASLRFINFIKAEDKNE